MSEQTSALLLAGGRVLDPASGLDTTADVLVEHGEVVAIETSPGRLDDRAGPRYHLLLAKHWH